MFYCLGGYFFLFFTWKVKASYSMLIKFVEMVNVWSMMYYCCSKVRIGDGGDRMNSCRVRGFVDGLAS